LSVQVCEPRQQQKQKTQMNYLKPVLSYTGFANLATLSMSKVINPFDFVKEADCD